MEKDELGNPDRIKEEIKFNTEMVRLVVVRLLTIGGGTVSMITDAVITGKKIFFIECGIFLIVILCSYLYKYLKSIKRILK